MLGRVSRLATGRRSKWVVIAAWVVLALVLLPVQSDLTREASDESETFLVRGSDSAKVDAFVKEHFDYGNETSYMVMYYRERGITPNDRAIAFRQAYELCHPGHVTGLTRVVVGLDGFVCGQEDLELSFGTKPEMVSIDGRVLLMIVMAKDADTTTVVNNVDAIRAVVPAAGTDGVDELRAFVTGQGGFEADRAKAVEGIDGTLMIFTAILILAILLFIYRSPVVAAVPLLVVALAYLIAAGIIYGLVEAGLTSISGQTTAILIVLMFGAGTDYCLLILSRYKDELRRTADHHLAMAHATERTAPAILSSGTIVVAVMACLAVADFNATREMGPLLALGILVMMVAGLTLLPASLAALGRKAFWPRPPVFEADHVEPSDHGVWSRVSGLIRRRPGAVAVAVTLLLVVGALGNVGGRDTLQFTDAFRQAPDSVKGQKLVKENFTPGRVAPVKLIMSNDLSGEVVPHIGDMPEIESAYWSAASDGSIDSEGIPQGGEFIVADITLAMDPFSDEAQEFLPTLSASIGDLIATGVEARPDFDGETRFWLGGITAENYDAARGVARDTSIIVPLALLLILFILVLQLRALIAPLYLVATVVLSFAFALGVSSLLFTHVFGQSGSDPNLEIFAFIFLVGLGVDYNIFLFSRIREERLLNGRSTREAVLVGLEKTGGVITSAGLILAGTFSALMALTFEAMFQFGFVICLGLLVDTFLVRVFLVPAIAYLLDDFNWWPWGGGRWGKQVTGEGSATSGDAGDEGSTAVS